MLSDADKALYARQIVLSEIGLEGQRRLRATAVAIAPGADPRAQAVARDYLVRAGVEVRDEPAEWVAVASPSDLQRVAADPALEDCAAWLLGAFAAVETIKAKIGAGTAADFPNDYALGAEVQ